MHRKSRSSFVAVALMLVVALAMPSVAVGGLNDPPKDNIIGSTSTHPGPGDDQPSYTEHWWRMGWGNSLYPSLRLNPPESMETTVDGPILGIIYDVNRTPGSILNTSTPSDYHRATFGGAGESANTGPYGPNMDATIDLMGIYTNPPAGGWPVAGIEGPWYFHYNFYTERAFRNVSMEWRFMMDVTKPRPVTGLSVSSSVGGPPVSGWVPTSRAHITWDPAVYDDLSGVGYYEVLLDGKPVIPEVNSNPQQGRVYEIPGLPPMNGITIENVPPGEHEISIVTVDRATNRSVESESVQFNCDPDEPALKWVTPADDVLLPTTVLKVDATDGAGDPTVEYLIDGVSVATITAPPYAFKPSLVGLTAGVHSVEARATDRYGRTVSKSRSLLFDPAGLSGFTPSAGDELNGLSGTSLTNPNNDTDSDSWWRQGWGNSLYPQFTFEVPNPTPDEGLVIGMLYSFDRTLAGDIDGRYPDRYYRLGRASGTHMTGVIDVDGIQNHPPVGGWPVLEPGAVKPQEGSWWLHAKAFTSKGYISSKTSSARVGIDLTPPSAVANLVASPSLNPADAGTWVGASRAHITWTPGTYDTLSGVAYYEVLVNDEPYIPESETSPSQGRVFELPGITPSSITIEDMPAGRSKVSLRCVDRAGNKGPVSSTWFYSDPDTPAITITAPVATTINASPTFSAEVTDRGGITGVEFRLNGTSLGVDSTAPYSIRPNLNTFADGPYILTAVATDMLGRTAVTTRTIVLDKTAPGLTSVSASVSPFYPVQLDGYRDDFRVTFSTNEVGNAALVIKDSKGKTVRTVAKAASMGVNTIVWDGKNSGGAKVGGTYSWSLQCADAVGNTATTVPASVVLKAKTDETPPKISKVSANYKTFFPRKRDGYKDDLRVKFTVNEPGTAKLTIKNSKGKVVRTVTKKITKAGASSIVWNGKYTAGTVKSGTFSYKLSMTDKAGNSSSVATRKVTIKFYELVRTSSNALKVIER